MCLSAHSSVNFLFFMFRNEPDLRDDEQYLTDHPGAVPITTAQVNVIQLLYYSFFLLHMDFYFFAIIYN